MYQIALYGLNRVKIECPNRSGQRVFGDLDVSAMYQFGEHRAVLARPASISLFRHHSS